MAISPPWFPKPQHCMKIWEMKKGLILQQHKLQTKHETSLLWEVLCLTYHQRFVPPTGYFIPLNSLSSLASVSLPPSSLLLLHHHYPPIVLLGIPGSFHSVMHSRFSSLWSLLPRRRSGLPWHPSKLTSVVQIPQACYLIGAALKLRLWIEFLPPGRRYMFSLNNTKPLIWSLTIYYLDGCFWTGFFLTGFSASILTCPNLSWTCRRGIWPKRKSDPSSHLLEILQGQLIFYRIKFKSLCVADMALMVSLPHLPSLVLLCFRRTERPAAHCIGGPSWHTPLRTPSYFSGVPLPLLHSG